MRPFLRLQPSLGAACCLLGALLATGCASAGYRKPTPACTNDYSTPATTEVARETRARALQHPAYQFIPFQRDQMHWCDPRHVTWYCFGNDADGIFGEGMAGEHPYSTNINCLTWVRWSVLRNFGHNAMFYPPLGSACLEHHWNWSLFKVDGQGVAALARDHTGVFGEGRSSFKINLNDLKPFMAVKLGRFESYFGWRERGNFGVACRLQARHEQAQPTKAVGKACAKDGPPALDEPERRPPVRRESRGTGVPPVSSATRARGLRHYFAAHLHGPNAFAKTNVEL